MDLLYNEKQDIEQSSSEIKKDSRYHVRVTAAAVDDALRQTMKQAPSEPLTPEAALRLRKKIDKHLLPLMMIFYGQDDTRKQRDSGHSYRHTSKCKSIVRPPTKVAQALQLNHLPSNWLGTIFYIAYLVFEYPQNLALQRFQVGKWMSINVASHVGESLFNHGWIHDHDQYVLYACGAESEDEDEVLMNGTAQIISGFLSFGVLHIETRGFAPWQWFFIITGAITLATAAAYFMWFPDSPATAWFLTLEERAMAIERIKVNQTGVENKVWKKYQFIEALTDYKTWLFALFSCLGTIPNSLTNQRSIIINSFGFTELQTTLLACVDGAVEIITIYTGVLLASKWKDGRGYVAALYFVPNILGSVLMNSTSFPIPLLVNMLTTWRVGTTGFVLVLGWLTAVVAGHTKKITVQAIMLSAYCVGNLVGPQMWQEKYKPRNRVPWAIITTCYVLCPLTLLTLRFLLARENKKRDAEPKSDATGDAYIEEILEDGTRIERKIDKAFLDLTDIQNREFRYVL
ncbi:hypothetical protein FRC11_004016 [Ceratobasidium sp. 423]|nr:hypothetical protein FRC11_004016 [Ceratobasidium sp. 423]